MNNKEFAKTDEVFKKAYADAGLTTKPQMIAKRKSGAHNYQQPSDGGRQAGKWKREKGLAWKTFKGV